MGTESFKVISAYSCPSIGRRFFFSGIAIVACRQCPVKSSGLLQGVLKQTGFVDAKCIGSNCLYAIGTLEMFKTGRNSPRAV